MEYDKDYFKDLALVVPRQSAVGNDIDFAYGNNRLSFDATTEVQKLQYDLINDNSECVYANTKKKSAYYTGTVAEPLSEDETFVADSFGPFNEIEYSANLTFRDKPQIDMSDPTVRYNTRVYYAKKIDVRIPSTDETRRIESVFRHDRQSSAKLKAVKRVFGVNGLKITWTAAIEVSMPKLVNLTGEPERGHKTLSIIYWNLIFHVDDAPLVFRVAFRYNADTPNGDTQCNIECESRISLELFVIIYHMLALYYKTQFLELGGSVSPLSEALPMDALPGLTDCQRSIARTVTVSETFESNPEPEPEVSAGIAALTRYTALRAYLDYGPETMTVSMEPTGWDREYEQLNDTIENTKPGIQFTPTNIVYC